MTDIAPVVPNPPKGRRPVPANARVDELNVDPAYQRELSRESVTLIRAIATDWDWSLCQPLIVARRADDSLWVVDGQHRRAAAALRGDILDLPCVIIDFREREAEARAFVALNTARRPLTAYALWRAAIGAGDAGAIALEQLLARHQLRFSGKHNKVHWQVGELGCVTLVQRLLARFGYATLDRALAILIGAFGDEPLHAGPMLLIGIISAIPEDGGAVDRLLIEQLRARPQDWWAHTIRQNAAASGTGQQAAVVRLIGQVVDSLPAASGAPATPSATPAPVIASSLAQPVPAQPAPATPPPSVRARAKPRTFEEQLAAVAAGAPIAAKPTIRKPDPEGTLGGVGSGML